MQNYYKTVELSLNTIAYTISEHETNLNVDSSKLQGRLGSSFFEDDFLKPLIRKYSKLFKKLVNDKLDEHGITDYRFVSIDAPENTDEAAARTMEDVAAYIQRPDGTITKEIINIKATNGNTADNVGGWVALDHVLYGESEKYAKTRKQVLEKISNTTLNDSLNDYFLWVFYKNEPTGNLILNSSSVHSMLNSNPESFQVNMSQTFPLQFNSHKAHTVKTSDTFNIEKLKHDFMLKILDKGIDFYREQLELWEQAATAIKQQQKEQ